MTREREILKKAGEYAYLQTSDDEMRFYITSGFRKGAEWADRHPARKQSIWHNANETPSENSKIVVIDMYGEWYNISYSFDDYDDCFGKGWESCVRTYNIDKWAYLDDLINL